MTDDQDADCAICLQCCHHPTQLPCGHVFCFLCVKGIAFQNKKCAMCRAEIPHDYLDNPVLLKDSSEVNNPSTNNDQFQWYYEGRNGWWKYDERSNIELETAYVSGEAECMLLLAGALYRVDFQSMLQVRRGDRTRRRKVKRDTPTLPAKGVAGIKQIKNDPEPIKRENEVRSTINNIPEVIEISDDENNSIIDESELITEVTGTLSNLNMTSNSEQT